MIPADTHTSTSTHPNKTPIRVNRTLVGTGLAEVIMGSTIQKPTRLTPLQKAHPLATAKDHEDHEEPSTSDQSHLVSPSNLFSLEKHLGGEFPDTPQKASKSVPKKIDLVNQQPPKPYQQNNLEPTQNLILSASDQPSSSSHIQILEQPPLNILESEYIEAELLKISEEMKTKKSPYSICLL